jgi:hypothetical protein
MTKLTETELEDLRALAKSPMLARSMRAVCAKAATLLDAGQGAAAVEATEEQARRVLNSILNASGDLTPLETVRRALSAPAAVDPQGVSDPMVDSYWSDAERLDLQVDSPSPAPLIDKLAAALEYARDLGTMLSNTDALIAEHKRRKGACNE